MLFNHQQQIPKPTCLRLYFAAVFKINEHDSDGDITEEGIFLCFGPTTIRVADSLEGFTGFIVNLQKIEKEIADNY